MKKMISILCAIVILLFTNGCTTLDQLFSFGSSKESVDEPVYVSIYGEFSVNPMRNHNLSYHHFSRFVFDSLFTLSENFEPIPSVVESYSFDKDGKRLHLKLYKDILWHDGERLTTEDISFTIGVHHYALLNLKGEDRSEFIPFAAEIRSVEIIDELNCDLIFHSPSSFHLSHLTFPLFPAHVYQGEGMEKYRHALSSEEYVPIGCGPYKWVSAGSEIQLEKFRYHREPSHHLKKIYGRILSSEKEALEMFEHKKINFAELFELNIDKYKKNGMIKSVDFVSYEYECLIFNYDNPIFQGDDGRKIRQIITSLIPQKEIVREAIIDRAVVCDVPVSPKSYLYFEDKKEVMRKKEMIHSLQEIGYEKNKDGLLVNREGESLKFRMIIEEDPVHRAAVGLIASSFENVGIVLEPIFLDQSNEEWKKTLETGRYDLAWSVVITNEDQDLSMFFDINSLLYADMKTSEEDQMCLLWKQINVELDEKKKNLHYKLLQEMIRKEVPHVGLFFRKRTLFSSKDFMGDLLPDAFNPYRGISKLIYTN